MSSSFFLKKEPKGNNKRKLQTGARPQTGAKTQRGARSQSGSRGGGSGRGRKKGPTAAPPPNKKRPQREEEIASDDDDSDLDGQHKPNLAFSSDEGDEETPQDKRLRLAKDYLVEIEKQEAERAEERDLHDHVAQRLQTDYLDSVGKLRRQIAASIEGYDAENVVRLKHKLQHLPICALALSPDGQQLFSGAKTQYVLKWDLKTQRLLGSFNVQPHTAEVFVSGKRRRSHVLALAISSDMKFLALAEGGNNVQIWCPTELKHLKTLKGHRDVVSSLTFRKDTHELYTGSRDRSVKIWSLDEMAYVESLFGHQAGITGIDALSRERAVTSGGTDCSLRIWKITEESQLIYNGHSGSIDSVKFINDEHFMSSGDDGTLCLWSALKKKPLCKELLAHGTQTNMAANWISAIACVVNSDLLATGSCDGYIRLWQTSNNARKLTKVLEIPVVGFVNSLAFNADGTKLYAAIGQEHRLGRWWRNAEAKNYIACYDLERSNAKDS